MGLDCWLPIYNDLTRAGLQSPNGTKEAVVLWVRFWKFPSKVKAIPDAPLVFHPYGDYLKSCKAPG
jgi:hypothetical protein